MRFLLWLRVKGRLELPFPTVFLLVCGAGLVLGGCADWDDTLQQDVVRLRRDVNALMIAANRGRGESESLAQIESRYRAQAAENERRTAQISGKLDSLSAELSELSARLDSLSQRIEDLGHPGQRLGAAPRSLRSSGVVPSPPSPAPPTLANPSERGRASATPSSGPTHGASTAQESYQAAYLDFSKGRYELAIQGFREFIHRFPDSPLADSAQYSIGESYFSLARASASAGNADRSKREMEQSVQEFRRVLVNYPRGSKVPTALYKEALALTELKQTTLAQARLQYLLDHFPQSEEAPLARESLAALKQ